MVLIFGYGSLIWKSDFPFLNSRPGYILNYVRRFWQSSTDHRGTELAPGRVVTLIPLDEWTLDFKAIDPHLDVGGGCWGMVYEIDDRDREDVFRYLDLREQGGYTMKAVNVHLCDGSVVEDVYLYIALTSNPSFLGPGTLGFEGVCDLIAGAGGPSGFIRLTRISTPSAKAEEAIILREALRGFLLDSEEIRDKG